MTLVDDCCSQVGVFLYVALVSMMTELQGKTFHSILLNTAGKKKKYVSSKYTSVVRTSRSKKGKQGNKGKGKKMTKTFTHFSSTLRVRRKK